MSAYHRTSADDITRQRSRLWDRWVTWAENGETAASVWLTSGRTSARPAAKTGKTGKTGNTGSLQSQPPTPRGQEGSGGVCSSDSPHLQPGNSWKIADANANANLSWWQVSVSTWTRGHVDSDKDGSRGLFRLQYRWINTERVAAHGRG